MRGGVGVVTLEEYAPHISLFAEQLFNSEQRIDSGKHADVFADSYNTCCYKVVTRFSNVHMLMAEQEMEVLHKAWSTNQTKVKVPAPLFSFDTKVVDDQIRAVKQKSILCMERIDGPSLKNVLEGSAPLPANFDFDVFFGELEKFIRELNTNLRIHHRDLHSGNVLIDKETGMPAVIDFGVAKEAVLSSEDPYEEDDALQQKKTVFDKDIDQVFLLKKKLREHMESSQRVSGTSAILDQTALTFTNLSRVGLYEAPNFVQAADVAHNNLENREITNPDTKATVMPGALGLFLVKADSNEFQKRISTGLILYPKIIDNEKYYVCRQ